MKDLTRLPKRTQKGPVKDVKSPFLSCIPVYVYEEIGSERIPQYIEYFKDPKDGVKRKIDDLGECVGRVKVRTTTWDWKVFNSLSKE